MALTVKVKNETDIKLEITLDGSAEKLEIEGNAQADVEEKFLKSAGFARLMGDGKIRIEYEATYTDAQTKLARNVIEFVLNREGKRMIEISQRAEGSVKTMQNLRDNYNKSWKAAEASISLAFEKAKAAEMLAEAAKHFLYSLPENKEVAEIEDEIKKMESEDLAATGRSLADWYKERRELDESLSKATARRDATKKSIEAEYGKLPILLQEAAGVLQGLDPKKSIGKALDNDW